ncbi:MAG: GNAT family N-acetyltransferase [Bacteroides sp.]|nr:GNAT family N-acetyltransferase [Bacteroides sp.]
MNTKIIETERLILRPITENDTEEIFEYSRNENVGPNAGWKPHENIQETREIMKAIFLDKEFIYGIVLKDTNKMFGSIGLTPDPKRQNDKARMIGYAIGENYWGKGYATEAAQALVRYGLEELELELISAYCYPFNEKSKRVIEKCGFHYEGKLSRVEKRYDGVVLDNECYAIISSSIHI